jgi:hypothetical protein
MKGKGESRCRQVEESRLFGVGQYSIPKKIDGREGGKSADAVIVV